MEGKSKGFFRRGGSVGGITLNLVEKELLARASKYGKDLFITRKTWGEDVIVLSSVDFGSMRDKPFTLDIAKRKLGGGVEENFVGIRWGISF